METSYDWRGYMGPAVVYAPHVPRDQRAREKEIDGLRLRGWRPRKKVQRLGDQALDTLYFGNARVDFSDFWQACCAVWESAQPVAGVVDLTEVDLLLAAELWTGAQLVSELGKLEKQPIDTEAVSQQVRLQLDSRRADLEALAEQNRKLFEAAGTSSIAAPDVARRALDRAEALDTHRPVRELGELTDSLREVVERSRAPKEIE
ncbi:hypothetical protein ACFC6U_03025 [Kitasatospora purpeofusca]|uniref:hypothetical protein n=1 Tax=Kitasatospora purpeofusca TaxID=67352 RepID=UPI0035E1800C